MPMIGDDAFLGALSRTLDGLAARQRAIAQNVANVETPNYRAKTVDFESSLKSALSSNDSERWGKVDISFGQSTDAANLQGNNVQLDKETVALEETSLRYQMMTQAVSDRFKLLRTVIKRDI